MHRVGEIDGFCLAFVAGWEIVCLRGSPMLFAKIMISYGKARSEGQYLSKKGKL